jgi:transcription termination factor Rho
VTDTDLIMAAEGIEATALPIAVSSNAATAPGSADVAGGSLATMVLPELRALAGRVGVKGTSGMRKGELIAAIRDRQGGPGAADGESDHRNGGAAQPAQEPAPQARRERRTSSRRAGAPTDGQPERPQAGAAESAPANGLQTAREDAVVDTGTQRSRGNSDSASGETQLAREADQRGGSDQGNQNRNNGTDSANNTSNNTSNNASNNNSNNAADDDGDGRQGRRGRRFRDRKRRGDRPAGTESGGGGGESELREDDVVQPVAGILDVLDNYAFVRTSGYLAGHNDVYVSMNMVRKNGLRRGDAVTGAVRVPRDGEQANQRQKFNPLVRLDTVNGGPVDAAKNRPEFSKLTPLYPNQRLRLETTSDRLTTRIIDLIMPIGKGQRALIVSPPKAGKTTIMQDIANAITRNNPECHLMVVLVDERPEEVTDMQRSVKGEVIASTFDRPPSDHTQAAELAIERAKRLVEQGKDVVVLLDSITRLGRAYNNASPASGRILSGGVDSTALYPPKRFLGAARNIENGGSLTIIATAMVETGSTGDTVIFEEFKGTGNAELKLDRKIAERRVFPAVDVNPSGTRKDELLLSTDEFAVVHKLRRVLSGLDSHQAIDLLMSQLRKTRNNYEFLVQVSKTAPGAADNMD